GRVRYSRTGTALQIARTNPARAENTGFTCSTRLAGTGVARVRAVLVVLPVAVLIAVRHRDVEVVQGDADDGRAHAFEYLDATVELLLLRFAGTGNHDGRIAARGDQCGVGYRQGGRRIDYDYVEEAFQLFEQ